MVFFIFSACYFIFITIFVIIMIFIYITKYKGLSINLWKPGAAWTRAFIYFSFCNMIITISGTLEQVFTQSLFTIEQIKNPYWLAYCIVCFIYIFLAYWILWSRMTLTFNRKHYIGSEVIFGIIWGFSTGGLLLSFYHLWRLTGVTGWVLYLLSFGSMGLWQYFIQDYFWDIYISPEHDTPKSIIVKTAICHIPNIAICLGFLTVWNNYAIFIVLQIFALIASTIFQKFPAPWAKGTFNAPMVKKGIFGFPHGSGYLGKKKKE
ncbi:MAG: hypothetical protein ACFE85_18680 [Candidatus Hodarchaeota archaeon]